MPRPARRIALAAALLAAAPASASDRAAFIARFECDLVTRLARMHEDDRSTSRGRFLSVAPVDRPGVYVQCMFFENDAAMLCEAASGAFRQPDAIGPVAPPGRARVLRALGFRPQPDGNDVQTIRLGPRPDFSRIARLILIALHDAYDVRAPVTLGIRAPGTPQPFLEPAACAQLS